jgi:hypothetical protein
LEHRIRVYESRKAEAHRIAAAAQRLDKNDPFIYARVYSRIMNGVGEEHRWGAS